eukprot:CAMPEP_0184659308 /NCGR_PEP_ID=MMETSP0308-20130426/29128_1 /TAXON_ID=38269 /ORGANISM="Gloeochaete witrockiana, Strain SAG 46.84" /LENGTH=781 /DNA_ID=CAMNT_0027099027 /DNA_START=195 /DNA_END=2540 /DNA_ORIENTATION=+
MDRNDSPPKSPHDDNSNVSEEPGSMYEADTHQSVPRKRLGKYSRNRKLRREASKPTTLSLVELEKDSVVTSSSVDDSPVSPSDDLSQPPPQEVIDAEHKMFCAPEQPVDTTTTASVDPVTTDVAAEETPDYEADSTENAKEEIRDMEMKSIEDELKAVSLDAAAVHAEEKSLEDKPAGQEEKEEEEDDDVMVADLKEVPDVVVDLKVPEDVVPEQEPVPEVVEETGHVVTFPKSMAQLAEWAPCRFLVDANTNAITNRSDSQIRCHYSGVSETSKPLGPVVFVTPELGKWSAVGGLGVMVDELSQMLAEFNEETVMISPYYDRDRKGRQGYLTEDNIHWKMDIYVTFDHERIQVKVHEGVIKGVRLLFLQNQVYFPSPYPNRAQADTMKCVSLFCRAALEALCCLRIIPAVVVTNDWFTGLMPAYAKREHGGFFGDAFCNTTFFHIVHNLDPSYEGRIYPNPQDRALEAIHKLPVHLLVDQSWERVVVNPSRCAFMTSSTWGTVSPAYRWDLVHSSPLAAHMTRHQAPFAFPNGVPVALRTQQLEERAGTSHDEAKKTLQERYFNGRVDPTIPLFAFVGRITEQKGVHLICQAAWELAHILQGRVQILIGGKATWDETYSGNCARELQKLRHHMPHIVWADPNLFFTDGPVVNLGADFGLMPSLFEPGGIVQQEFFVAGTPVVAFKTGGLKDTVHEYDRNTRKGNGFNFQSYHQGDFVYAIKRACEVFAIPEQYHQLRQNARESVVDASCVGLAWLGEFYRLRGRGDDFIQRFKPACTPAA